jgi:hypothetical protein
MTRAPARFSVRLPPTWDELDLARAARTAHLARTVDARLADHPELGAHRGALVRVLRDAATDAERRGAVFCAVMVEPDGAGGVLLATAMALVTAGSPDPDRNRLDAIAADLAATAGCRVHRVELAAGAGVRMQGVRLLTVDGAGALDCVTMQTVVPVPGDGLFVNLVLASPRVELAEPLLDLFEAITATLSWLDADEPPRDVPASATAPA